MSSFVFTSEPVAYTIRDWFENHAGGSFLIVIDTIFDSMLGTSIIEAFGAVFTLALFTIIFINAITFMIKAIVCVIKVTINAIGNSSEWDKY